MWFEQHPYISIYLAGSALVVVLTLFKVILFWFVGWVTKGNILAKNLKKILEPNNNTFLVRSGLVLGALLVESLLSWINVVVIVWQIFLALVKVLREALTTVPEEIKLLRFPLWNNPDMSRESVWAYAYALGVKAGNNPTDQTHICYSLDEMTEYYYHFDRKAALKQLSSLDVVSDDLITTVLERPDFLYEDSTWDEDITEDD
jgi:hypothetical protein